MQRRAAPSATAHEVYSVCVGKVRPASKRARLQELTADVVSAAQDYETAAESGALHTLGHLSEQPADEADRSELRKNYKQRMAHRKGPGYSYYEAFRESAGTAPCPLCGHREVSTLDHHLPKTTYPLLSVVPVNLVPACGICNHVKGDHDPTSAEQVTLHPFYDDLGAGQWLFGRVDEGPPAAVQFSVQPSAFWDTTLTARVRLHFRVFGLGRLYGAQAARDMSDTRGHLAKMDDAGVRAYLKSMADSCAESGGINYWRAVMYQALAANDWYISGGFRLRG